MKELTELDVTMFALAVAKPAHHRWHAVHQAMRKPQICSVSEAIF
ncbi:hypothetical protein [Rhizobium sp. CCGE 510]|nr:hypothetical protein [Rhizobium sp. CCGE 510]